MRKSMIVACALIMVLIFSAVSFAQSGKLVIWSAASEEEADALVRAFRSHYPEIGVDLIRAGSGELLTRLQVESPRPGGDILLGIAKEAFDGHYDFFVPYKAKYHADIPESVRDKGETPRYYGYSMPLQAFIVNTELLKPEDCPRKWADLIDDKYEGEIILANPALSGSAYAQIYMIYKLYGWDFLEKLARKAVFTASSTMVPASVARGGYAIGVTGEANVASHIEQGDPVIPIYPEEGTGARFDASGIIKGGPNLANAQLSMDFLTSEEAYRIILETRSRRVVHPKLPGPGPLPPLSEIVLIEYDAQEAADIRDESTSRFSDLLQ
ncbi:MAG: extracellular solute-binding protein [Acutalibacteraceae bacterium]